MASILNTVLDHNYRMTDIKPTSGVAYKKSRDKSPNQKWWVYIIRCRKGNLYTGITTDLQRRFDEHRGKQGKGAKSLRGKGPLRMVWYQRADNRSKASRLEYRIKQLSKAEKEAFIDEQFSR